MQKQEREGGASEALEHRQTHVRIESEDEERRREKNEANGDSLKKRDER